MNYPTWHEVENTFINHVMHYRDRTGEDALLHLNAEESVGLQYAGRVVLELFQNALDRADQHCFVSFENNLLVVANDDQDSKGLSINPNFDYTQQNQKEKRSDFHALCALHASSKSVKQNFGNKGIGFRSVFAVSNQVEIWSRLAEGGWWGLELVTCRNPADWKPSGSHKLDEIVKGMLPPGPRPSFYLPRLLHEPSAPHSGLDGYSIAVLLRIPEGNDTHLAQIGYEVEMLKKTRLHFITLRQNRSDLCVTIGQRKERSTETGWQAKGVGSYPDLAPLALAAKLELDEPRIALRWGELPIGELSTVGKMESGFFYNYLPTQMRTGLPIDIHGDFQVKADREGMNLQPENSVGRYNNELLQRAAELHVKALIEESQSDEPRVDFWQLAGVPKKSPVQWLKVLKNVLFPDGKFQTWSLLAENFFRAERFPAGNDECYSSFWDNSQDWVKELCGGYDPPKATWANKARNLCELLANQRTRLVPIQTGRGRGAVPLPIKGQPGGRADSRLFFKAQDDIAELSIPKSLLDRHRSVTDFPLSPWDGPMGAAPFSPTIVLQELRQLASDPSMTIFETNLEPESQRELLAFASILLKRVKEKPVHFAWRASENDEKSDKPRMGRALATLFLPTIDGRWEPARQLTLDRVHRKYFANDILTDELLNWLGVAPACGMPVVEGGDNGWVEPRDFPPSLQDVGPSGKPLAKLEPLTANLKISQVANTMAVFHLEDNGKSKVHEILAQMDWLPGDLMRSEDGLPATKAFIAPRDILIVEGDDRCKFLARLKPNSEFKELMLRLTAIPKLNADCKLAQQRSMFLLKDLKQRYPNPDNLRPEHRSMFISLVRVLIAILPVDYLGGIQDTAVPILVDKRGSFFWLTEGGNREAWLVDGDDHNEIKRFFPDLPLVVGDSKKGLSDLLNLKQVTLNKKVKYTEYFLGSPLAFKLTQEIKPIVHKLCAIAEISRLSTADSMADRVRRAWFQSGSIPPLMHSKDTYVEVIAEGTRNESTQWRLNKFEDVFYLPGSGKDPGQIVFDTASLEIGPPLWHFGEALALQLTNNPSLGPLFAESLAAYREGTLDSLLERRLATEAVRRWRKELEPIAGVERERLLIILHTYIKQPDSCLDAGKIRCKDIREGNRFKTVGELMACIEIQLGTLKKYLPRITIEDDNINEWDKWYSIWHKRLWVWIRHNTLNREEYLERDLQEHIKLKLKDILFDPQDSVTQWLSGLESFRQPSGGLEITLANFVSETFTPVSIAPVHYTAASWKIGRGMAGGSKSGPEGKLENIDIFDEQIAKSAWGDQAEKALLNWVKANTQAIIRQDPEMKKTLLTVLPNKTKTYKTVSEALDQQDYDKALHVAELWSGLGFDIIGLEKDSLSQQCFAVRYECKGLPSADRRVHVHLSRREIGVARKVTMDGGPGLWKLIGVKPSGAAVDLTDAIQDLRINNSHILRSLHDKGLEHDGLRLVIEQR